MKTLYYIPTGEEVKLVKDLGTKARIIFDSGEVSVEDKQKLAFMKDLTLFGAPVQEEDQL